MCVAEIGLLFVGGAKVVAAFAKADKIIKGSKAMINAYKALGSKWDTVLNLLTKYVKKKSDLTSKQVKALEEFLGLVGNSVMTILGLGSCWSIYQELT